MNIKITHNWLLEYIDTKQDPYKLAELLTLCGPSVERVEKYKDDYVYDIEITSNRIDTACVWGIAQEVSAILPTLGSQAKMRFNPKQKYNFGSIADKIGKKDLLKVTIKDDNLCSRFTALVIKGVKVDKSPEFIKERLAACGINSINNLVDISNYVMLELGQPSHIFDYDKIKGGTMIMRNSKKGEKVTTLDGKTFELPGDDIVIEDGEGRLIDLAGIMGGQNSAVSPETKNIVLFVQTYNKTKVRRTSMTLGQRSLAVTYFEKGLDEERVETALVRELELILKYVGGEVASKLYDIYKNPYTPRTIKVDHGYINKRIGVGISKEKVLIILNSLGFETTDNNGKFSVTVPSFRKNDVKIKEDIVEEVARVYGYHNLPNNLQTTTYVAQPPEMARLFKYLYEVKNYLKHLGLNEVMNYSMIGDTLIKKLNIDTEKLLELKNPISEDLRYLRNSLIPSLVSNAKTNQGKLDEIEIFEISKIYIKRDKELPLEKRMLAIAVNTGFLRLKGLIEALFREFNAEVEMRKTSSFSFLDEDMGLEVFLGGKSMGYLGKLNAKFKNSMEIKDNLFISELDFDEIIKYFKNVGNVKKINPYAVIKLDYTFELGPNLTYSKIESRAKGNKRVAGLEVISLYKNKLTVRFYFQDEFRNLTEEEAKTELQKIVEKLSL